MTDEEKLKFVRAHHGKYRDTSDGEIWTFQEIDPNIFEMGFLKEDGTFRVHCRTNLNTVYNNVKFCLTNDKLFYIDEPAPIVDLIGSNSLIEWCESR